MAFRFGDGFSYYATAQIPQNWSSNSGGVIRAGEGRGGRGCLAFDDNNKLTNLDLGTNEATLIVGTAYKIPTVNFNEIFLSFQ